MSRTEISKERLAYAPDDFDCICKKNGRRIAVSGHAKSHMVLNHIFPETLCDMVQNPVPCPSRKGKPHRKTARRICAMRKKTKYNIILDPFNIDGERCWVVSNMEPIQ